MKAITCCLAIVSILMTFSIAYADEKNVYTGMELYSDFKVAYATQIALNSGDSIPVKDLTTFNMVYSYLEGIVGGFNIVFHNMDLKPTEKSKRYFKSIPGNMPLIQNAMIYTKWAEENPEFLNLPAWECYYKAMEEAFVRVD